MIDILLSPYTWFGSAAIVGSLMIGYIAYEIASFHFRRKKEEAEREPDFYYTELQRELDKTFAPLTEEQAARMTP